MLGALRENVASNKPDEALTERLVHAFSTFAERSLRVPGVLVGLLASLCYPASLDSFEALLERETLCGAQAESVMSTMTLLLRLLGTFCSNGVTDRAKRAGGDGGGLKQTFPDLFDLLDRLFALVERFAASTMTAGRPVRRFLLVPTARLAAAYASAVAATCPAAPLPQTARDAVSRLSAAVHGTAGEMFLADSEERPSEAGDSKRRGDDNDDDGGVGGGGGGSSRGTTARRAPQAEVILPLLRTQAAVANREFELGLTAEVFEAKARAQAREAREARGGDGGQRRPPPGARLGIDSLASLQRAAPHAFQGTPERQRRRRRQTATSLDFGGADGGDLSTVAAAAVGPVAHVRRPPSVKSTRSLPASAGSSGSSGSGSGSVAQAREEAAGLLERARAARRRSVGVMGRMLVGAVVADVGTLRTWNVVPV